MAETLPVMTEQLQSGEKQNPFNIQYYSNRYSQTRIFGCYKECIREDRAFSLHGDLIDIAYWPKISDNHFTMLTSCRSVVVLWVTKKIRC